MADTEACLGGSRDTRLDTTSDGLRVGEGGGARRRRNQREICIGGEEGERE